MKGKRELDVTPCRLCDFRLAAHTPKHKSPTPPTASTLSLEIMALNLLSLHFFVKPYWGLALRCRVAGKRVLLLYLPMQSIVGG